MSSRASQNLKRRMKDIDQLMKAHTTLTQFQRATKAASKPGVGLARIADVVNALVTKPGKGRPSEVAALNKASIVLLSAHLQGYIEDLFSETAEILLKRRVKDIDALVKQGRSSFSNPYANRIDALFASVGLPEITDDLKWEKASNRSIKERLSNYIKLRNEIAHGKQEVVHKATVMQFKQFVELFAQNFDDLVSNEISGIVGKKPW